MFPELGLAAYTSEDLFRQDALLEATLAGDRARPRGHRAARAGDRRRRAAARRAGPVQRRRRDPPRPDPRRRPQELPARVPRVLREAPVPRRARPDPPGARDQRRERPVRQRPAVQRDRRPQPHAARRDLRGRLGAIPPSTYGALAGATVLANLSASNIIVGKSDYRHTLCAAHSARTLSAYLYTAAGAGESTTDLAWDGQALIYENGDCLAESERYPLEDGLIIADVDLDRLVADRAETSSWGDSIHDHRRRLHADAPRRVRARARRPARSRWTARSSASRTSRRPAALATSAARRSTGSRSPGCRRGSRRPGSRSS